MKKVILSLTLATVLLTGGISYASQTNINIEKSNTLLEEGKKLDKDFRSSEARIKLNEAIKLNPKNAEAYNELARLELATKNNCNGAISYYKKAIEIDPQNDEYYSNLALAENINRDDISALKAINKAIEINPQQPKYYMVRGAIYDSYGYHKKALDGINKYIELTATKDPLIYRARAEEKIDLRDYDGAIKDYELAMKYDDKKNHEWYQKKIKNIKGINQIIKDEK